MSTSRLQAGDLGAPQLAGEWVLVFGGTSELGHRRATRAVTDALDAGFDVVWFDGFASLPTRHNGLGTRHETKLVIVDFSTKERASASARLRSGDGWKDNAIMRKLWTSLIRRVGVFTHPRACWVSIRDDMAMLQQLPPPVRIVCCADEAIPSAWHASRAWPDSPVVPTSRPSSS